MQTDRWVIGFYASGSWAMGVVIRAGKLLLLAIHWSNIGVKTRNRGPAKRCLPERIRSSMKLTS